MHIHGDIVEVGDAALTVGDEITIDGSTGKIYAGALPAKALTPPPELFTLLAWADEVCEGRVEIRVNAETAEQVQRGVALGASGIGLCRTEHMFLAPDRLPLMRRFLMEDTAQQSDSDLDDLRGAHAADLEALLDAVGKRPATIRLLDPPVNEFLPDLVELEVRAAGRDAEDDPDLEAVRRLHESNPTLGTRGVRLAAVRPALYRIQLEALCIAMESLVAGGKSPQVEVLVPMVSSVEELRMTKSLILSTMARASSSELISNTVTVGAMIETPRAAILAMEIAQQVDFLAFGTNDLTQMTFGLSRDDAGQTLIPTYRQLGLMEDDPFIVLDQEGVGELVRIASQRALSAQPTIRLGVCGEHASDPSSIAFLISAGISSLSCPPNLVPVARLAAARALLDQGLPNHEHLKYEQSCDEIRVPRIAPGEDDIDESRVLYTIRLRGFATPDGLEASLGVIPRDFLNAAVSAGYVRHIKNQDMYTLYEKGHDRLETLTGRLDNDVAPRLGGEYELFLRLNVKVKELCTRWQLKPNGEPNDHTEKQYDALLLQRLEAVTRSIDPVLTTMATVVTRLGRYRLRLRAATDAVAAGESRRFAGVMCESFHDVWMELHEDLITLQGIDRSLEDATNPTRPTP